MSYRINFTGNGEGMFLALPRHIQIGIALDVVPLIKGDPWGGEPLGGGILANPRQARFWRDNKSSLAEIRYLVTESDEAPGEGYVWITDILFHEDAD